MKYRSAITGRFVSEKYAKKHPKTTVKETDSKKVKRNKLGKRGKVTRNTLGGKLSITRKKGKYQFN